MNFAMMSGSFWASMREFRMSNGFDELFQAEEVSLDSLLDSDEVIQETRYSNKKFLDL